MESKTGADILEECQVCPNRKNVDFSLTLESELAILWTFIILSVKWDKERPSGGWGGVGVCTRVVRGGSK